MGDVGITVEISCETGRTENNRSSTSLPTQPSQLQRAPSVIHVDVFVSQKQRHPHKMM